MTTETLPWAVAALVAVATSLSSCGGAGEPAAAEWQEPARYTYVLESACGERALIGRFRITVEQGRVAAVEGVDESGRLALEHTNSDLAPTLRQLVDEANRARQQGAAVAEVATDPADGHPTEIDIDWRADAIDDEACYTVTDYRLR